MGNKGEVKMTGICPKCGYDPVKEQEKLHKEGWYLIGLKPFPHEPQDRPVIGLAYLYYHSHFNEWYWRTCDESQIEYEYLSGFVIDGPLNLTGLVTAVKLDRIQGKGDLVPNDTPTVS